MVNRRWKERFLGKTSHFVHFSLRLSYTSVLREGGKVGFACFLYCLNWLHFNFCHLKPNNPDAIIAYLYCPQLIQANFWTPSQNTLKDFYVNLNQHNFLKQQEQFTGNFSWTMAMALIFLDIAQWTHLRICFLFFFF